MSEKKGLPRPPFYTNEYIDMAEILEFAIDRFGKLILAIMYYTADGTEPENLPPDLNGMFAIYKRKIDFARNKYEETCEKNKKNGKNGGRPRKGAADADLEPSAIPPAPAQTKKPKAPPKIKMPPPEQQFADLIEQAQADGRISEECDPAELFEWAETLKWKVNGEPAKNVGDFLTYAEARHPNAVLKAIAEKAGRLPLSTIYGIIFKQFHGLRDEDGNTRALTAAVDFLNAYNDGWNFHDKEFSQKQWREALDEFMEDLKTE